MKTAIVIPARYASTRLPGKPLTLIAGQTLLERVVRLSALAAKNIDNVTILVATDDERIQRHCDDIGVAAMMTSSESPSGTDRVAEAIQLLAVKPDFILNMQGDAPFTPPAFLRTLINAFQTAPCDVITPVTQLTWQQLDTLRLQKQTTPFSGTTAIFDENTGNALWFSKNIIPALRQENHLRAVNDLSPIYRHIGLYGYSLAMLQTYHKLPETKFEKLEGLEQLRLLQNGYQIRCVPINDILVETMSGIDSPEDIIRAEAYIAKYGELIS